MSEEAVEHVVPPVFYCPIPFAVHPAHERFTSASVDWLDRFQLYTDPRQRARLVLSRPGWLAALAGPRGLEETLQLSSDFLMWLYAFDDEYCEEGTLAGQPGALVAALRRMLRVAESATRSGDVDNYCTALLDLRLRLDRVASRAQVARWLDMMRAYLFDQVWCAHLRAAGEVPPLNDYLTLRLYNGSMGANIALVDVVGGYEVSAHELQDPRVRALGEICCALVGWDNDIMSYNKERSRVGDGQNLLEVLRLARSCTLSEAVTAALTLRDSAMCRFVRLRDEVMPWASPQLRAYLAGLGSWIRANHEWGQRSPRYVEQGDVGGAEIHWAATPVDDGGTPPGIPAINHWWTVS